MFPWRNCAVLSANPIFRNELFCMEDITRALNVYGFVTGLTDCRQYRTVSAKPISFATLLSSEDQLSDTSTTEIWHVSWENNNS